LDKVSYERPGVAARTSRNKKEFLGLVKSVSLSIFIDGEILHVLLVSGHALTKTRRVNNSRQLVE